MGVEPQKIEQPEAFQRRGNPALPAGGPFLLDGKMAKVKFSCDSGANIHSNRTETLDTVDDLGMEEGEWENLDEDGKFEIVNEWAQQNLEISWKEVK